MRKKWSRPTPTAKNTATPETCTSLSACGCGSSMTATSFIVSCPAYERGRRRFLRRDQPSEQTHRDVPTRTAVRVLRAVHPPFSFIPARQAPPPQWLNEGKQSYATVQPKKLKERENAQASKPATVSPVERRSPDPARASACPPLPSVRPASRVRGSRASGPHGTVGQLKSDQLYPQ